MKILYVLLFILFASIMFVCIYKTKKANSTYSAVIIRLIFVGILSSLAYTVFLLVPMNNVKVATFFDGLYFVGTDWLSILLAEFAIEYTDLDKKRIKGIKVIRFIALVDSVSLLVNTYTKHMFTIEPAVSEFSNMVFWSATFKIPHYFHLFFCYISIMICIFLLVKKMTKTPGFYKKKYGIILALVCILIIVNALCYSFDTPIDLSVMLYVIFAICVCYFAIFGIPIELMENAMSYVVEGIKSGILFFDIKGKCVYANKKAKEMFNIKENENPFPFFEQFYSEWTAAHLHIDSEYIDVRDVTYRNGYEQYIHEEFQIIKDKKQIIIGSFFQLEDYTEEQLKNRAEYYKETHDYLTDLLNRESFFVEVSKMLSISPNVKRLMLCSNIKDFKLINDLFGIEMGDEVLKRQAQLMRTLAREDDICGRITGDKFAMIMPKERFNEEIFRNLINNLCLLTKESSYRMHIHVGIYEIENPEESVLNMYDKASMSIEKIKNDYHEIFAYYDDKVMKKLIHEKNVVSEFDRAIENKEFTLYLQPQVCDGNKVYGAEALVRWQHPVKGIVFPGDFIQILEKAGLIYKLDKYIWESAVKKLREWKDRGKKDFYISVNISAKDFLYLDVFNTLKSLVEKYDVSPENLKLEITETILMTDVMNQMDVISRLREYGFKLEMDDFGSGYSSLNSLKDIDIDIIKIDMLFIRDTNNAERSRIILESVISMARSLKLDVICEGVETKEQVDMLIALGCNVFQGYYFSKPVTVMEFEQKYFK